MSTYGKRGGTGATAGRKVETLRDPVSGDTKRVFFGQRWLSVVQQNEAAPLYVSAWHTEEEAKAQTDRIVRSMEYDLANWQKRDKERHIWANLPKDPPYGRPDIHYTIEAELVK